jgi:hypothetical protein
LWKQFTKDTNFTITPREAIIWGKNNLKPVAVPGKKHFYTDTNYYLLGLIIENITNKSFYEVMHQYIFEPLGMKNAFVFGFSKPKVESSYPIPKMTMKDYSNIHPDLEELVLEENGEGYVLKTETKRKNLSCLMPKRMKKIVKGYLPYQFRHTFVTELSKAGVSETQINFLVGKLPEGTLKHYLKADLKLLYESICKIPNFYSYFTRSQIQGSETALKLAV